MENRVTGVIWAELDKPGLINLHFDDDKIGNSIHLTPNEASEVIADLSGMLASLANGSVNKKEDASATLGELMSVLKR